MGGAASRFSDTDWENIDGQGLKDPSETFDGAKPTESHGIFYLTKKSLVNQRDCELRDEENALLYTTTSVEGTTKDFDVLQVANNKKLFHVHTDSHHSQWDIYSYQPNYEGQQAAAANGKKVQESVFKKAKVTITWDKYHGVVSLYEKSSDAPEGTLSKDFILRIEEIKSITPQFQSFVPQMSLIHPQLCGFWVKEHTPKTDRFKMHLAKGTDVALHGILAVITNIVQVERQADKCN